MNQQDFERQHEESWESLAHMLEMLESGRAKRRNIALFSLPDLGEFPTLYRQVCHDLALARDRRYTPYLIDKLDRLVSRGHQHLYTARTHATARILDFVGGGFPALVRSQAGLFGVAFALLYLPGLLLAIAIHFAPEMVYTMLDPRQVASFQAMYQPGSTAIGPARDSQTNFMMFGVYVRHNIGIGFQTFAGGLLLGLGTLFYLVFNSLFMGAVAGYLSHLGYGSTFYPFAIGHGAFELNAIVLSGVAGFRMGLALLAPGRLGRLQALKEAARISIRLVYGVVGMFLIAALIEAFWSSSGTVPPDVKYTVGAGLWMLVAAYFLLLGRNRAP
ncbi:MAG: stage II sporulation protein M [Betaproteobacteria bacterium]|nr:stage II sporulation protein M [Betaproteobacteria bacterium]